MSTPRVMREVVGTAETYVLEVTASGAVPPLTFDSMIYLRSKLRCLGVWYVTVLAEARRPHGGRVHVVLRVAVTSTDNPAREITKYSSVSFHGLTVDLPDDVGSPVNPYYAADRVVAR